MYTRSAEVYDAIYDSIGRDYAQEAEKLHKFIQEHKRSPGNPYLHANFVDRPDLKVVRMNVSAREGNVFIADFHFLVGTPEGIEYFTERHELGMFTDDEYRDALRSSRLEVFYDPEGPMGRGLFLGRKLGP